MAPFARVLVVGVVGVGLLITGPLWHQTSSAAAQCVFCPPGYGVAVTPDGVSTPTRLLNTSGYTANFTIQNTGETEDTYGIGCSGSSNVSCTGTSTSNVTLPPGHSTVVTASYNVGATGTGSLTLSVGSANTNDAGYYVVPVGTAGMVVTPDAGTAPDRPAQTGGYSQAFTVQNTGTAPETFSISCGGSSNVTCTGTSTASVSLGASASTSVTAFYNVTNGGTGALTLTATGVNLPTILDVGSVGLTITLPAGAPRVDVSPYNPTNQNYGACAQACFAAVHAQSTVPYISLDAPRNVTLVYNSDRHHPRPFVHVNVEPDAGYGSTPTEYRLQVRVNGTFVTFVNGEQTLRFAYAAGGRRIGGQFSAPSYATGAHSMEIVVSALYSGGTLITTAISTKLVAVNEASSPIAAGWTLAGIQRLFPASDGSVVLTTGDGSALFFQRSSGVDPFLSPPGDFSRLVLGTPTGGSGWTRRFADSTKVVFNSSGRMVEVRDRFNNVTTITYDGSNRVSKIRDPLNLPLTLTYGSNGLSAIQDTMGRSTTVAVDASRRLTTVQDPDLVSTAFGYDASVRLSTITNRRGHTTTLAYDGWWRVSSITAPAVAIFGQGTVSPVTTFAAWQRLGVPLGSTGTPVATPRADTIFGRVTDAGGHVTRFMVNRWGTAQQVTDPLGFVTTVTFDANGLPIRTLYPTGATDSTAYNVSGLPTYVRPVGRDSATYLRHAGWAQVDSTWGFEQPGTRAFIGANGRVDSTRTRSSDTSDLSVTRFVYDSRGRVETTTDPESHLTGRTWYAGTNGNRSKDSIPGGRVTTYAYDTYGRQTAVTAPGVATRTTSYDVLNRVVKDSAAGLRTQYAYDSLFLKSVTDPKGQVYGFSYNALGWVVTRTDPVNRSDQHAYGLDGELRRWTNRRGQAIDYAFDGGHRPTLRKWAAADSATWSYAANGREVTAVSRAATETHYLRTTGLLDSVRTTLGGQTFTQMFRYASHGALDSVSIAKVAGGGPAVTFVARKYLYDTQRGALSQIRLGGGGSTSLGANRDGQTIQIVLPGGDGWGTLHTPIHSEAQISTTTSYSETVNRYLSFDAAGRISRQINGDGMSGSAYSYDAIGRLTSDTGISYQAGSPPCTGESTEIRDNGALCVESPEGWETTGGVAFSYDAVGNRTDQSGAYATGNRIQQFAGCSYVTDSLGDGNVLRRACGSDTVRFHWTAESRLAALKVVGGDSVVLGYDAAGRLARRQVIGAAPRFFLWQGDNLLAELDSLTGKIAEYSYYPGLDDPHAVIVGTTPYFAHVDGKGNVIALTDSATLSLRRTYEYGPWGDTAGADYKPFSNADRARFKGALWLGPEVDLYYMRARWYEPESGRFLSEDPKGLEAGLNFYTYAGNDPVNASDPRGLEVCFDRLSQLRETARAMNATFQYEFRDGRFCLTGIDDLGTSTGGQLELQWSLGVWMNSDHTFSIDQFWTETAASVSRQECSSAVRNFGKSVITQFAIPFRFLRGLGRASFANYLGLRYGARSATRAAELRALGYGEAGVAGGVWAATIPEGGEGYQGTTLYKVAAGLPISGMGVALGEVMIYCEYQP